MSLSISIDLRNIQAFHISKATRSIATKPLKESVILARRYLNFRGYIPPKLAPLSIAEIYLATVGAFRLPPAEALAVDINYTSSLAFLKAAFATRLVSAVAGLFDVVKPKISSKVKFGPPTNSSTESCEKQRTSDWIA